MFWTFSLNKTVIVRGGSTSPPTQGPLYASRGVAAASRVSYDIKQQGFLSETQN